jgi:uroporphyrinogen decarboxylase
MELMKSPFLAACRNEPTDRVPAWFMRQAGRSLPEYRALKETHSILELCRTPELAAEVTLQPVKRLDVDAAILFSDIMVPVAAAGARLDIVPGVGPVLEEPIRSAYEMNRLRPLEPERDVPFVLETVRLLAAELDRPLIGFAGAPFTLACYLVEGGPSKDHARTKALMFSEPALWEALMDNLADSTLAYLTAQVEAGVDAVQLFDSWAGALAPADYSAYALPYVLKIFKGLEHLGVPRIYFGIATGELLGLLAETSAEVIGVDWRTPLDAARRRLGPSAVVQGNLDPAACLAPWEVLRAKALEILRFGGGRGHVFNLGHGVLPATDPDMLRRLVDLVHNWEPGG